MNRMTVVAIITTAFIVSTTLAEDRRTVSVIGHGETQVEPDIATVAMGIHVFHVDLLRAKHEADTKIANLLSTIETLAVKAEDIRTTQIYVKPKYKEIEDKWQFMGYEITRSVTVTLREMPKLNELLNKAIAAGANRLEDINLSSSKEREIHERTLTEAIANAKKRAARLAEGFGAKVGKVLTVDTEGGLPGQVMYCVSAPAFGEATFQPGRIKIDCNVRAVFELTD